MPDSNDSSVALACATLNVAYLIGEMKILAVNHALARSPLDGSSRAAMELFTTAVQRSSRVRLSLLSIALSSTAI